MNSLPTTNGIVQKFFATTTNPADASYSPDGLSAAPIYGLGGQPLQGNEIVTGGTITLESYIGPLLNSGMLCWVLLECEGGAQQVAKATQSYHAITLGQVQSLTGSAGSPSARNKLINGCAQISSRPAVTLSSLAQYGQVDLIAGWASGGTISAGMLTQDTAAPVGRTGLAVKYASCTLAGAGVISWRYRMESADAIKLKNQMTIFQLKVQHDNGSALNYTAILRKPTVADNFSTTTTIATSSPVSVASGQPMQLLPWLSGINVGDCSSGLEIEIQIACGAITTKNFWFTEWQLEEGVTPTPFEFKKKGDDLKDVQRYLLFVYPNLLLLDTQSPAPNSQAGVMQIDFPVEMRVQPTVPAITWGLVQCNTPVLTTCTPRGLRFTANSTVGGSVNAYNTSSFVLSAEL